MSELLTAEQITILKAVAGFALVLAGVIGLTMWLRKTGGKP